MFLSVLPDIVYNLPFAREQQQNIQQQPTLAAYFFFPSQIPRQIVSSRSFLMGRDAIPATCPLQWGGGVSSNMVKNPGSKPIFSDRLLLGLSINASSECGGGKDLDLLLSPFGGALYGGLEWTPRYNYLQIRTNLKKKWKWQMDIFLIKSNCFIIIHSYNSKNCHCFDRPRQVRQSPQTNDASLVQW
ncbi:hypothetical protein CEXT_434041 [Caerostris extrusa]|uniref:Uncharacterized protein n=1 Tax=Caerostris extrusa TaxID=172846 RepID=A0AAV4XXP9_CAEEX|nr:hypothetical protein CEXT_434041 [Caerostris extrusa]